MLVNCSFDISPDGSAHSVEMDAPLPQVGYRWISGSPDDPVLKNWCEANLSELSQQVLFQSETRPRALMHSEGLLLVLRGVNLSPNAQVDDMVSVRTFTRPDLIVTLRHRPVFALQAMHDIVVKNAAPATASGFLEAFCQGLVERLEVVSLALDEQVDVLEETALEATQHSGDLPEVAHLRRRTIRLRRYSSPLATALKDAARHLENQPDISMRLHESGNRALRSVEELEAARERLTALVDHLDMQNAVRQQNNGYLLSVIAAIFLPLGFLSGLFGVNVAGMPGTDWAPAFWVLVGLSVLCAGLVAAILRYLRWF